MACEKEMYLLFFKRKCPKGSEDVHATLYEIQAINPIKTLQTHLPETLKTINDKKPDKKENQNPTEIIKIPILKDCIQNAIQTGTTKGKRNQTAHIIATELRNTGITKNQANNIITYLWNQQNTPPLDSKEIDTIINAAFNEKEYTYGCREDGTLQRYLKCLGTKNCLYLKFLKVWK